MSKKSSIFAEPKPVKASKKLMGLIELQKTTWKKNN